MMYYPEFAKQVRRKAWQRALENMWYDVRDDAQADAGISGENDIEMSEISNPELDPEDVELKMLITQQAE
jgi:hypothetical protein